MRLIDVSCPPYGTVRFVADALYSGQGYLIDANCSREALDTLIFMDSRGVSGSYAGSIIERLLDALTASRRRYLAICRPLELTTWATLYNFLKLNDLRPPNVITNVGFVDFTPKKESILADAMRQVEAFMGSGVVKTQCVEHFVGEGGISMPLSSMIYGEKYRECIQTALLESSTVVVNTPPVQPHACGTRRRPISFFTGIDAANSFNRCLSGVTVIDMPEFDESLTYDGVHYTNRGNALIFELLKEFIQP